VAPRAGVIWIIFHPPGNLPDQRKHPPVSRSHSLPVASSASTQKERRMGPKNRNSKSKNRAAHCAFGIVLLVSARTPSQPRATHLSRKSQFRRMPVAHQKGATSGIHAVCCALRTELMPLFTYAISWVCKYSLLPAAGNTPVPALLQRQCDSFSCRSPCKSLFREDRRGASLQASLLLPHRVTNDYSSYI